MRSHSRLLAIAAVAALSLLVACAGPPVTQRTGQLANDPPGPDGEVVQVAGVIVEPPASSGSGTVFAIADSIADEDTVSVYYGESQLPAHNADGSFLSPEETVGLEVAVIGRWDGDVLVASSLVVKDMPRP